MAYAELEFHTTHEAADAVVDRLMSLGATGVSIEDPADILELIRRPGSLIVSDKAFEDALPPYVVVRAWFDEEVLSREEGFRAEVEKALQPVAEVFDLGEGWIALRSLEEEDWSNNWKQYYKPLKVSPRLVICPSWEDYQPSRDERVIRLDPGSAFGTGGHASTAMALELMDEGLVIDGPVLDVGSGSGILCIAAALLGAEEIAAIDIDPHAVEVTLENAAANGLEGRIMAKPGELSGMGGQRYRSLLMNLTADILMGIAREIPEHLLPGGEAYLSGIVEEKEERVRETMEGVGLVVTKVIRRDGWVAMVVKEN